MNLWTTRTSKNDKEKSDNEIEIEIEIEIERITLFFFPMSFELNAAEGIEAFAIESETMADKLIEFQKISFEEDRRYYPPQKPLRKSEKNRQID